LRARAAAAQLPVLSLLPIADLLDESRVIRVAFGPELIDQRLLGFAFQKPGLADIGLASAGHRLLGDPLEILEALLAPRQDINRVLQGHGADAGKPLTDLGAQVERLGGAVMSKYQRIALAVPPRGTPPALVRPTGFI
jgi:hypothetical protein